MAHLERRKMDPFKVFTRYFLWNPLKANVAILKG